MRKNTEFCLEVDSQQHIRSTQQYTKPSKMYLYVAYLFVCVCVLGADLCCDGGAPVRSVPRLGGPSAGSADVQAAAWL